MKTVVGLMDNYNDGLDAVRDLEDKGFSRNSCSIISHPEHAGAYNIEGRTTKGLGKGSASGAAAGGGAGFGLDLNPHTIPGIGTVNAAGPIVPLLGKGIVGALMDMGVPEDDAHNYAEGVRRGGTLICLGTDDKSADKAADILQNHGAVDIEDRVSLWKKSGWSRFDEKAAALTPEQRKKEAVLPVVEEEVKVGKRAVSKGGVRVRSYVTERPVEEKVSLREEHARVERRPVDRPLKAGEEPFKESSLEIEERAEEPVVSKQARVKEEVVVGKEASEHTETIHETARRTDVDIQEDADFRGHFKSNYASLGGTYESYDPAYRFAGTLSGDKRYMNKNWPEAESDVRRDWEKKNPGTWDKFKGAIRYGWDRMRGRTTKKAA